jgi:hypothetical protein
MSQVKHGHRPRAVKHKQRRVTGPTRAIVIMLQKSILYLARHWFGVAVLLAGIILGLSFLAPVLMAAGLTDAGQSIYRFLAPHDHQLPQRSYFLFGQSGWVQSYSLEQLLAWGALPGNLRAFIGNPEIGFKMALNQRMVAIFVAIFFGGLGWDWAGERPRLGPFWFLLLALPLLVDGFSHMFSENSGLGFRTNNAWAVSLTGDVFSPRFYEGATIGSLNWLLRTVTGLLFGVGLVWFLFTYFSFRFSAIRARLEPKFSKKE